MTLTTPAPADIDRLLEEHRAALVNQCRWILGSASEADDAVQETMVRAWQAFDEFEGRGSLLSWLRRIARNVCLDMMRAGQRRARPADPASWTHTDGVGRPDEVQWLRPVAGRRRSPADDDPAELAVTGEEVRGAFVAALLHLSPRQRSALLLCEVLRWRASEAAELLGTSVASVNSALQRARASLEGGTHGTGPTPGLDDEQRARLRRYVGAFERHDVDALAQLLRHHDRIDAGAAN